MVAPACSIVIPVLNEGLGIAALLGELASWRAAGDEVIVVDGGSSDDTVARAMPLADRVLAAPRGRASQQNAGAAVARGRVLWFVHADSRLAGLPRAALLAAVDGPRAWGRCAVRIDDPARCFRVIETCMNWRTRLTGIVTGDHGLFMHREAFAAAGGFPPLALMEDLALSRALGRQARPHCLEQTLVTSARRWRRHGVLRTVALMWGLRLAWFAGVPDTRLARLYGYD